MSGPAKLLSFGAGGHSVEYGRDKWGKSHLSGYDRPETIKLGEELEGVPVLDKRAAVETPEGYRWVFKGPMVDTDLADDECDRCPTPSAIFAGAVADNAYGGLLAVNMAHRATSAAPGPLDSVSVAAYIEGWREHGARVGVVRGGQIVWEN